MKMQYVSVSDYRADEPFEQKCKNCIYFSKVDDMDYPYNTDFTFLEILKNYGFAYIVGVISYIIFKLARNIITGDLL